MIITQNFIDMLVSEDATMTKMEYFLNSNLYNPATAANNFRNSSISWTELMYIYDYDARLYFRVIDNRAYAYNSLFIRTTWNNTQIIPSFIIEDIHNINKLADTLYENIEAWFFVNLSKYNIRCAFNYSPMNFSAGQNAGIYNRHWHLTGDATDSYVIRDVSSIQNYKKNIKCLMSRGQKSAPSGFPV